MTLLPQVLLSGLIFPLTSIVVGVRWIAYLLPLTYFTEISRGVMLRAEPIGSLWPPFVYLALLGAVVTGLATWRFRAFLARGARAAGRRRATCSGGAARDERPGRRGVGRQRGLGPLRTAAGAGPGDRRLRPGQVTAVVGGDGAGKTTLLRCVAGALAVTAARSAGPARRMGYLPPSGGVYDDLTVAENLRFRAGYRVPDSDSGSGAGRASTSSGPGSPRPGTGWPASSPAGCGVSWAWSRPCCPLPTCWSWTSRPPASTR